MDFMTDREFNPIFNRVSKRVNLKGAGSPAEINERLTNKIKKDKQKIRDINEAVREGWVKKGPIGGWKRKIRRDITDTKQLIFRGFGRRCIDEAITRPNGKVALTLRYGPKTANKVLLERARNRIGSLRVRKRSEWR